MSQEMTDIPWSWPLRGTTSDKTGPKTRLNDRDRAYALVGVDGSDEGGVRPFPGFCLARELTWRTINEDTSGVGLSDDANHDQTSRVLDCFPISLKVGPSRQCFGHVLRVLRTGGASADLYWEWYDTVAATWRSLLLASAVSGAVGTRMDVATWGRMAYVLLEGAAPKALYVVLDNDVTPTRMVAKVLNAGPGVRPLLVKASIGSAPSSGTGNLQVNVGSGATLAAGDYAFAYELQDTRTGRRSGISETLQVSSGDFSGAGGVSLRVVADSAKWDRLYAWRSIKVESGGIEKAAILFLDGITDFDGDTVHDFALLDKELVFQKVHLGAQAYDESVPYGGAATMLNGMLVVGSISGTPESSTAESKPGDELRNVGELRWSLPSESAPELFSPLGRFVTSNLGTPLKTETLGSAVVALCRDRALFVQKSGGMARVTEMHEGFGLQSDRGAVAHAGVVYWHGPHGLCMSGPDGSLEEVRSLDHLLRGEWGRPSDVWMASDYETGCVYGLSPSLGKAFCLWIRSASLTELWDLPFSLVQTGPWPRDYDDMTSVLVSRAQWVQNYPSGETPPVGWKPRVYVVDHLRERTISGDFASSGGARRTLLDVTGDACFTVEAAFSGADYAAGTLDVVTTNRTLGTRLEGSYVYVVWASDRTMIGRKAMVLGSSGGKLTLSSGTKAQLSGLAAGSLVAVSPVYVRWESGAIGNWGADDGSADSTFQRDRHVSTVTASWEDLTANGASHNTWTACVWRGNDAEPVERVTPLDPAAGTPLPIEEGSSSVAAAFRGTTQYAGRQGVRGFAMGVGVETYLPDVDYRLLGVKAKGRIGASDRN